MAPAQSRVRVVANHLLTSCQVAAAEVPHYDEGTHFGVLPSYEHAIHAPEVGILSTKNAPPETVSQIFMRAAANFPNSLALTAEKPVPAVVSPGVAPSLEWKDWTKWTWRQYYQDSRSAAKAFMTFGVEQFGSVSIFGFNAPEWLISAMGAVLCGGKYVGIYSTDTPDQAQFKISHSASAVAVVDGEMEFNAVSAKVDELPGLNAIVVWGMPVGGDLKRADGSICRVLTWSDCLKIGEAEGSDQKLDERIAAQKPGHAMGIIYTSGTTGNPKAVMMHHDGAVAQGVMLSQKEMGLMEAFEDGEGRILSYLPLSHIAGGLMDILAPVYYAGSLKKGCGVYFARPYDLKEMTLALRIQFVRPTLFLAVPRVFEKIQARMMAVGASITGIKKTIATWAKGKGLEHALNQQLGGSKAKPFLHFLADKLILSKAREALGLDKCKVFITGAAPIARETLEYFAALGMIIQNVYGMSESVGVTTVCSAERNVFGTVGHAMPGIEVKCFKTGTNGENTEVPRSKPGAKNVPETEQGELCYRGRHIMMGYMANPAFGEDHVKEMTKKNEDAIDKWGWLHSGDKGTIDSNGMVRITGRYKELIIGAGGENIAPVPVEENIKLLCPALSNVMMVGDNRKYNVALVSLQAEGSTGEFPGTDNLAGPALEVNPKVTKISQAIKDPVWQKYIQAAIEGTNNNSTVCASNAWKVQKFAILPRDFSIETGEFTATLKLKRSVAEEMWHDLIEGLYID
jgi:long-chain-fatty-acid--CoA ligase ACSBG